MGDVWRQNKKQHQHDDVDEDDLRKSRASSNDCCHFADKDYVK